MYFYEFARGSALGRPVHRARTASLGALLLALLLVVGAAGAEPERAPGESTRALPALVHVGVAAPAGAPVVLAGSAGYGFLDSTSVLAGGHEFFGTGAVAYSPLPELSFGLDLSGRVDRYSDPDVEERVKLYAEPRLTARFVHLAARRLSFGAELDARFVGAEAPSIEPRATSPSLTGLASFEASASTWLAANLGFHLDRSARAVPVGANPEPADERTLGASSWNAFRWGLGASHRLSSDTELLGEVSGELLLGRGKPKPSRSPSRLSVGARQPFGPAFSLLVHADASLSRRPLTLDGPELLPIEPRVDVAVALIWRPGASEPAARANPEPPLERPMEPPPPKEPVAAPEVPTSPVSGSVVDEGGRPLPDAEVTLSVEGEPDQVAHSSAEGAFEFLEVPQGRCRIAVVAPGYDAVTLELRSEEERTREIVLHESVPAGQLRGRVLDLQGSPLRATLSVEPGGQVVEAQGDGSFELELSPGRYTVTFRHEGFAAQKRTLTVTNRGVVILDIALVR